MKMFEWFFCLALVASPVLLPFLLTLSRRLRQPRATCSACGMSGRVTVAEDGEFCCRHCYALRPTIVTAKAPAPARLFPSHA